MLNAKGRITPLARIFPVPRLSFVSQRTAYASETGKTAREKPRPKADYMLTENQLRLLNANDASFRAVGEKLDRKGKIHRQFRKLRRLRSPSRN